MRTSLAVASAGAALLVLNSGAASAGSGETGATAGVIVYWSEQPWPSIWKAARTARQKPQRILRNRQNAKRPRLSPDRQWVAFDGAPPGKPLMVDFDIQRVRIDGTGRRTLTTSSDLDVDAQWAPDGQTLSFTRMPPSGDWLESWIWSVKPDGTDLRRIARGQSARWSPDGTQLVLDAPTATSDGDIFIVNADGSERRLVLASRGLDQPADWSPDGKRILFTRFNDSTGRDTDVFVMNIDGTGLRKLAGGYAACWSPDGSKILYADSFPGRLFVMDADGSHKRRLAGIFVAAEPDWR